MCPNPFASLSQCLPVCASVDVPPSNNEDLRSHDVVFSTPPLLPICADAGMRASLVVPVLMQAPPPFAALWACLLSGGTHTGPCASWLSWLQFCGQGGTIPPPPFLLCQLVCLWEMHLMSDPRTTPETFLWGAEMCTGVCATIHPLIERRFWAWKHCPTTTGWSSGETMPVVAQGGGGGVRVR